MMHNTARHVPHTKPGEVFLPGGQRTPLTITTLERLSRKGNRINGITSCLPQRASATPVTTSRNTAQYSTPRADTSVCGAKWHSVSEGGQSDITRAKKVDTRQTAARICGPGSALIDAQVDFVWGRIKHSARCLLGGKRKAWELQRAVWRIQVKRVKAGKTRESDSITNLFAIACVTSRMRAHHWKATWHPVVCQSVVVWLYTDGIRACFE